MIARHRFVGFGGGFPEEGIKTRAGIRVGDHSLPARVLLAGQQKTGEVRHLLAFVGREGVAKLGDLGCAHGNQIQWISD